MINTKYKIESGVDLQETDISRTNLRRTILRGAGLQGAGLQGADLRGTNLHNANLQGTDLYEVKGIRTFTAGNFNRFSFAYIYKKEVRFQIGCFNGNAQEALDKVNKKYGEDSLYKALIIAYEKDLKWQM